MKIRTCMVSEDIVSVVTGVMVCGSVSEEKNFKKLNEWLEAHNFSILHRVEEFCCNGKHPQMIMAGGGYNYFKNRPFAEFFLSLPWEMPGNAVLIMDPEEGTTFVVRPEHKEEIYFW